MKGQLLEYIVKRHGRSGRWAVLAGYDTHTGYLSEFAAIQDAVDAAYAAGEGGYRSCVLSQATDDAKTLRWTYGQDAYPYDGRDLAGDKVTTPLQSSPLHATAALEAMLA